MIDVLIDRRNEPLIMLQQAVPISEAGWSGRTGWYVLACHGGRENEVGRSLDKSGLRRFIPMEDVRIRGSRGKTRGKVQIVQRPFMPGYVFVECAMCATLWHGLRTVRHVIDIVSARQGDIPMPVEAGKIEAMIAHGIVRLPEPAPLRSGDRIKIVNGPFRGFMGCLLSVDKSDRIRVLVDVMGAAVPVQLETADAERMPDGRKTALQTA